MYIKEKKSKKYQLYRQNDFLISDKYWGDQYIISYIFRVNSRKHIAVKEELNIRIFRYKKYISEYRKVTTIREFDSSKTDKGQK